MIIPAFKKIIDPEWGMLFEYWWVTIRQHFTHCRGTIDGLDNCLVDPSVSKNGVRQDRNENK